MVPLNEKYPLIVAGECSLVIEDPLRPDQNPGVSCYGFQQIKATFIHALSELSGMRSEFTTVLETPYGESKWRQHSKSLLGCIFSTTHHTTITNNLRKEWCPITQKNVDVTSYPQVSLQCWSEEAFAFLQQLSGGGEAYCRICGSHNRPGFHRSDCQIERLLSSYHSGM